MSEKEKPETPAAEKQELSCKDCYWSPGCCVYALPGGNRLPKDHTIACECDTYRPLIGACDPVWYGYESGSVPEEIMKEYK